MDRIWFLLVWLVCLGLNGCGDLPTPFKGNPGAAAQRLAQPPAPLLAVAPSDALFWPDAASRLLADNLAAALQMEDVPAQARRPQPTDWQLLARADQRGGRVVPIFTVRDPAGAEQGSTEGAPVLAAVWAASDPGLMRQIAAEVAPKVSALLTSIRIGRDRADPNSLFNRVAKVMVADVTGAPGDGNQSLTRQVRTHLAEYGLLLQTSKDGADFEVRGDVAAALEPNRKQRVEIVWTILAANGDERGKVVQLNEIPAGMLDHYWGDVAVVVGTEAAGGLYDVILKQSGRDPSVALIPKPAPVAQPVAAEALPEPPLPPAKAPPRTKRTKVHGGGS